MNLTGIRNAKTLFEILANRKPVADASREGHFISIFEFSAERDPTCDSGYFTVGLLHFFLDIVDSSVTLDVWVESKDELFDFFFLNSLNQRFNAQLVRSDAIQRRN